MNDQTPIDVDLLLDAVRIDDENTVIQMFHGRTEPERREVAPMVFQRENEFFQQNRSLYGACFACGTLTEIKRLDVAHKWGSLCNDVTYEILVDRRPKWVTSWAHWALERQTRPSGRAASTWTLVRKLIRAGVCEPLDTDAYILGMIFGLGGRGYNMPSLSDEDGRRPPTSSTTAIPDLLFEDPGLLEHEIWRIFEVPGRPSRQLGHTKPCRDGWNSTMVWLSKKGHLDRGRLLTATLDGLARDITAYQANWFIGLWWMLKPTTAELDEHQARLAHLLAHNVPAVVQFALKQLETAMEQGVLATAMLLEEVEPVLLTMPAATVKEALNLLDRIVKADIFTRTRAMTAAATALLHTNKAVRAAAVTFLARHAERPDPQLAQIVDGHLDGLTVDQIEKLRVLQA